MATNSSQMTVSPAIPADMLCGLEGHLLMSLLSFSQNDVSKTIYFYADGDTNPMIDVDDDLLALVEDASGPIADKLRELDLENMLGEEIDLSENGIDYDDLLLAIVQANPKRLPMVEAEGCWHSSKMRAGEFGGYATLITPEGVTSVDSTTWLMKRRSEAKAAMPIDRLAYFLVGFEIAVGSVLVMNCVTSGSDHDDEEHELPAGALAIVNAIEMMAAPQGLTIDLTIPVDPTSDYEDDDAVHITNRFDEADTKDRFAFRLATEEERAKLHPSWLRGEG